MDILMGFGIAYIIPTIIAAARSAKHGWGILILNLFLGWTFIGWVGALIWAVSDSSTRKVTS